MSSAPVPPVGPVRAVVVDPNDLSRRRLSLLVMSAPAVTVVGEVNAITAAGPAIIAARAQVAVISADLLAGGGVDRCVALGRSVPGVHRIVVGPGGDHQRMAAARRAGAAAYIPRSAPAAAMRETVLSVMRRARHAPPAGQSPSARSGPAIHGRDPRLHSLGPRELEVLTLMADGMVNRQIGDRLHIADSTLRNTISSLFGKLAVKNRQQAISLLPGAAETR